jgi:hypothetical protein
VAILLFLPVLVLKEWYFYPRGVRFWRYFFQQLQALRRSQPNS